MDDPLRLMAVLAHPDDESLGFGGTLARYAAEGVATYLVTATRGERGWFGDPRAYPGLTELGRFRTDELQAAAQVLGIRDVTFLDYIDGDLDQAAGAEAIGKIVTEVRRARPQVVLSFGPDGAYGHPDHIAISQLTTAALICAADASYRDPANRAAHCVSKLYYMVMSAQLAESYTAAFGDLLMTIDGVERHAVAWPDWAITTRVDAAAYWNVVWEAVRCHRSQLPNYDALADLSAAEHRRLWGEQCFYRAFSAVNSGRALETDLFAGLRAPVHG